MQLLLTSKFPNNKTPPKTEPQQQINKNKQPNSRYLLFMLVRKELKSAEGRTWTGDTALFRRMLYQLSYLGKAQHFSLFSEISPQLIQIYVKY